MQEEEKKGQILTKRTLWVMAVLCTLGVLAYNTVLASCYEAPAEGVQWRRCYMDGEDFSGLSLEKAELRESSFTRATLHQTNLRHTDARRAKFIRTILTEAQFTNANLREADFTKANADGADFSGA
ncbi:MAG: pentapeptide repeat-containing protein, partial [Rickettsiales bacterium]|nr:pentapeptide repeat-containing protein [Rickettsiales bacterium]